MKLAKGNTFQTVFVSEVTRLGRNTREVLEVVKNLAELGINIISIPTTLRHLSGKEKSNGAIDDYSLPNSEDLKESFD